MQQKPLLCQLLNTTVPVSWMECAKTLRDHSPTCQPCVLAAAGSSRLRRFNSSLGKADVSGSWSTWEVTTANSLRGLPPLARVPLPRPPGSLMSLFQADLEPRELREGGAILSGNTQTEEGQVFGTKTEVESL